MLASLAEKQLGCIFWDWKLCSSISHFLLLILHIPQISPILGFCVHSDSSRPSFFSKIISTSSNRRAVRVPCFYKRESFIQTHCYNQTFNCSSLSNLKLLQHLYFSIYQCTGLLSRSDLSYLELLDNLWLAAHRCYFFPASSTIHLNPHKPASRCAPRLRKFCIDKFHKVLIFPIFLFFSLFFNYLKNSNVTI